MAPHLNTTASIKHERSSDSPSPPPQHNRSIAAAAATNKRHSTSKHHRNAANTSNIAPTTAEANADILQAAQFRHRRTIDELLSKRTDLRLIDTEDQPPSVSGLCASQLGPDDEVWMFQCARNVPVERLVGVKLTLNGTRKTVRLDESGGGVAVEYQSEELPPAVKAKTHSMVCRPRGARRHELVAFKPVGTVRVHEEIQELLVADIERPKQKLVPYPAGLKVRHPLHGDDYEKHTRLPADVQNRLRSAVRASRKAHAEPPHVEPAVAVVKEEKTAKSGKSAKKRKSTAAPVVAAEEPDEVAPAPPAKKAKRVKKEPKDTVKLEATVAEADEELGANLDWLSAI